MTFGFITDQVPNVTDIGLKPRTVKKVAVIGGGLMGSGIATALALSNTIVILKEINSEFLQKGMKAIEGCRNTFFMTIKFHTSSHLVDDACYS